MFLLVRLVQFLMTRCWRSLHWPLSQKAKYGALRRDFVKKCCFNINLLKCYCFEIIEKSSFFLKSCLEPTSLTYVAANL